MHPNNAELVRIYVGPYGRTVAAVRSALDPPVAYLAAVDDDAEPPGTQRRGDTAAGDIGRPAPGGAAVGILAGRYELELTPGGARAVPPTGPVPARPVWRRPPVPRPPGQRDPLFGRGGEIQQVLLHARPGRPLGFHAPCGSGKSSLLHALAGRPHELGGPLVSLRACHDTYPDDLLQGVFELLYRPERPCLPEPDRLAGLLRRARAVVLVDDVALDSEELDRVLDALEGCTVVLTAADPIPAARVRWLALAGLPDDDAFGLLCHGLGRRLTGPERAQARRLCRAVDGHPLRLRQAAALAGQDGLSLADLADQAECDPLGLDRRAIGALTGPERRALAMLAFAGGALLPRQLVGAFGDLGAAVGMLDRLPRRGLAEQRRDRLGLPICLAERYRPWLLEDLDLGGAVDTLVARLDRDRLVTAGPDQALEEAQAALAIIKALARAGDWPRVVRLAEAAEPFLLVAARWGAWRETLEAGMRAARHLGQDAAGAAASFAHQLGTLELCAGRPDRAAARLQATLERRRELGDREGAAVTGHNLALARALPVPERRSQREPAADPPGSRIADPQGPSHVRAAGGVGAWARQARRRAARGLTVLAVGALAVSLLQAVSGMLPWPPRPAPAPAAGTAAGPAPAGPTTSPPSTDPDTMTGTRQSGGQAERTTTTGGQGPALLAVDLAAVDFGVLRIGDRSPERVVTVHNDGDTAGRLAEPRLTGHTGDFQVASGCGTRNLLPDRSCRIGVRFAPRAEGARTATLRLRFAGSGRPLAVQLTGEGKRATAPGPSLQAAQAPWAPVGGDGFVSTVDLSSTGGDHQATIQHVTLQQRPGDTTQYEVDGCRDGRVMLRTPCRLFVVASTAPSETVTLLVTSDALISPYAVVIRPYPKPATTDTEAVGPAR